MSPIPYMNLSEKKVGELLSTGLFDADYYLRMYPDVYLSQLDPLLHYLYFGHIENRNPSTKFDTQFYRSNYMSENQRYCPLIHYIMREDSDGVKLRSDNSIEIDLSEKQLDSDSRLAIQIHLYYPENFDEIVTKVKEIPSGIDLLISTTSETKLRTIEQIATRASLQNKAEFRVVNNVGRDQAPLFVGFADTWSKYDYICHLHSKQSPHTEFGDRWRNYLFDQLIGSRSIVTGIISLFERDDNIGVIYPDNYFEIKSYVGWNGNEEYATEFLKKVGFTNFEITEKEPDLLAGSMCWMRTAAYAPLNHSLLSYYDFEPEEGQLEGTLAHILERCLTVIPVLNGYRTCKYFNDIQNVEAYRNAWAKSHVYPDADVSGT